MSDLRVLLVDDEPLARAGLRALLRDEGDVDVIGESATGADAVAAIDALAPDVVFLDIALPDFDGFDILERVPRARRPVVVFVTAHSDHALRAFEARALDYVTKPIRRDRVREAVARARDRIRLERLDRGASERRSEPRAGVTTGAPLALKIDGRVQLIDQGTIDWISADDDHVIVHAGDRTWRTRETLREVSRRLDPARFVRIHRSTIVRLAAVRELQPWFHGDYIVILYHGAKLRLSRGYRDDVATMLGRSI